jgi:hypothetical protein
MIVCGSRRERTSDGLGSRRRARSRPPLDAADGLLEDPWDLAVEFARGTGATQRRRPGTRRTREAAKADFLQHWIEGESLGR